MLCFLPPPPAILPPRPDPGPRRPGPRAATAIAVAAVGLAVLTPFGWAYDEPQFSAVVGRPLRLPARREDLALRDALVRRGPLGLAPSFRAGDRSSVPPGLAVDPATGTLGGTPAMAGTYTLALAFGDGRSGLLGRRFRLKVLPAPPP